MHARYALLAAAAICLSSTARADPVALLSDNFNAENAGAGAAEYSGFANWTAANVDLLAPGYFFGLCEAAGGSTPCIDMEGSGNGSLTTRTAYALAGGTTFSMSFDLAGDQRGRTGNAVLVQLVSTLGESLFSESFSLASDADFTSYTRSVVLPHDVEARFSFLSTGPADSMGMLLDNVVLTSGVAPAVPEPTAALMLIAGLAGTARLMRRRDRS